MSDTCLETPGAVQQPDLAEGGGTLGSVGPVFRACSRPAAGPSDTEPLLCLTEGPAGASTRAQG